MTPKKNYLENETGARSPSRPLKKKKSFLWDTFAVLAVLFIFTLILTRYSPPVKSAFNNAGDYTVSYLSQYPALDKAISFVSQYSPFKEQNKSVDYSQSYTYLNYSQLEEEYSGLNLEGVNNNVSDVPLTSIVVLNYHGTVAAGREDTYSISVETFKEHMFALKKEGYRTLDTEDLYLFLRGEKELYGKYFVLTFDDGLKDTYYNVDPILKLLDYEAVMFVITGQSLEKNSRYYLNKDELHTMHASGRWDIQTHSHGAHTKIPIGPDNATGPFFSNKLWIESEGRLETNEEFEQRIRADLSTSKSMLEQEFNKSVRGFALPFGEFGQRESNYYDAEKVMVDATRDYFNLVFYQFKPATNKDFRANYNTYADHFYLVMRISADSITSSQDLINEMNAAQSLPLPYTHASDNNKRWINLWGQIRDEEGVVSISNVAGTYGAMAYLDGSYVWKDYVYTADVLESNSEKTILLARFQDSYNYAGCRYTNNTISIINVRDRIKSTYNLTQIPPHLIANRTLSVSVQGDTIACGIGGQTLVEEKILHLPPNGGVGIRVEDFEATYLENKYGNIAVVPYYG